MYGAGHTALVRVRTIQSLPLPSSHLRSPQHSITARTIRTTIVHHALKHDRRRRRLCTTTTTQLHTSHIRPSKLTSLSHSLYFSRTLPVSLISLSFTMASNVCYSYQQSGQCKFGANCRFSHGDEPTAMGQGGGGYGGGGGGGGFGGGGGYGAPRRTAGNTTHHCIQPY